MERLTYIPASFEGCEGIRVTVKDLAEGVVFDTPIVLMGVFTHASEEPLALWDYDLFFHRATVTEVTGEKVVMYTVPTSVTIDTTESVLNS